MSNSNGELFKCRWVWNKAIKTVSYRERRSLFGDFPRVKEAYDFLEKLPLDSEFVRTSVMVIVRDYLARFGPEEFLLSCLNSRKRFFVTACTRGLQKTRRVETLSAGIREVMIRNARKYLRSWVAGQLPHAHERTVRTYVKTVRLIGTANDLPLLYSLQRRVDDEFPNTLAPKKVALAISRVMQGVPI